MFQYSLSLKENLKHQLLQPNLPQNNPSNIAHLDNKAYLFQSWHRFKEHPHKQIHRYTKFFHEQAYLFWKALFTLIKTSSGYRFHDIYDLLVTRYRNYRLNIRFEP